MPAEAADTASKVHPALWTAMGIAIMEVGKVAVAFIRRSGRTKEMSIGDKLDLVLSEVGKVKLDMATRADVAEVHKRLTDHIQAHAEGKFREPA